jgi:hypothetical protein
MKNVKSSEISYLKANHHIDQLVNYGNQLHSEAVRKAVLKFCKLFSHDRTETVQFREKRGNLEYSH